MTDDFLQTLRRRLESPLPGPAGIRALEPELNYGRHYGPAPENARRAAVMLLLYPHQGEWWLPLTLRPPTMTAHAGQFSLPGGSLDYGESTRDAARRELAEELGIGSQVPLLGKLSEVYVYVSNFRVTPWLGYLEERPQWRPNPAEVAEVLEVPLRHLIDRAHRGRVTIRRRGLSFTAPCFIYDERRIWGATSLILGELVTLLEELGFPD